ncbi:MAG: TetR/AcrR family transcriptional regulator, partial [Eubacterium sp.]
KDQTTGADLQLYMNARLHFFSEHTDFGKIFFEAVLKPPKQLDVEIAKARKCFDDFNHSLYQSMLKSVVLRAGVTQEEAMDYFTLMQTMFNGYFSSPAFSQMPFCEIIWCHENKLSKLLEFMLYGIAEREVL